MLRNTAQYRGLETIRLVEARERAGAFVDSTDCWPDWSRGDEDEAAQAQSAHDNAPHKVLLEIGLVLGGALGIAALATLVFSVG
jgi:hypothetical protein